MSKTYIYSLVELMWISVFVMGLIVIPLKHDFYGISLGVISMVVSWFFYTNTDNTKCIYDMIKKKDEGVGDE